MFFKNTNYLNWYKTAIFLIMAVFMIIFIGKIMDVALMFFGAFIIASSVLPVINKLKNYMPRALSVLLVLFLVFVGILLIFIPLLMVSINQAAIFINDMPHHLSDIQNALNKEVMGFSIANLINDQGFENIGDKLTDFAGTILSSGLTAGKFIASSLTGILMIFIMVFYLCMDENHIKKAYIAFFPPKFKKKAFDILNIMINRIGGYVTAQLLTMVAVGLVTFIGLLIIGYPHPVIIGFLTFVLDFIPVVGPIIAVLIGTIAAYDFGIGYMALVLLIMLIAQLIENQVVRPLLFGKFMNIHPLLIIISLLIGAKFLGFAGVILGPAFASLVCILVDELYIKQINSGEK